MTTDAYVAYTHRFFANWLPVYDLFARSIAPAYRAAVRAVDPRPGLSLLDVCTGTGEIALRAAGRGAAVTGVDVTPGMLAKARRKAAARDLPVRFELMDARRLAFDDGAFDVAVLSLALHDMPRRVRVEVLREAARVARREVVVLDYELPEGLLGQAWKRSIAVFETAYFEGFTGGGVAALLGDAGLAAVAVRRLRPWPFAIFRVAPATRSSAPRSSERSRPNTSSS